jgi:hypothetical protein
LIVWSKGVDLKIEYTVIKIVLFKWKIVRVKIYLWVLRKSSNRAVNVEIRIIRSLVSTVKD